jgi:hypothetical protein
MQLAKKDADLGAHPLDACCRQDAMSSLRTTLPRM